MTRTLHKTPLQQHHTPTLQTSACKSVSAHLSATNKGSQAGLNTFADLAQYLFTCRQDPLTSKAAEPSFFVVLADIRLVVPSHRGPQVLWSTDGSFSERVGEGSGWLLSCSGEGPWGPGQNQTPDSLDRKKLAATAKFKPQTGAFGDGAWAPLWSQSSDAYPNPPDHSWRGISHRCVLRLHILLVVVNTTVNFIIFLSSQLLGKQKERWLRIRKVSWRLLTFTTLTPVSLPSPAFLNTKMPIKPENSPICKGYTLGFSNFQGGRGSNSSWCAAGDE